MAAMTLATANDAALAFMTFLTVLLAVSLVAVIRIPPWTGPPPTESTGDRLDQPQFRTARPAPGRYGPAQPARPMSAPPRESAQPGQPRQAGRARRVGAHRMGVMKTPQVSGSPPWGPAPKPPGVP